MNQIISYSIGLIGLLTIFFVNSHISIASNNIPYQMAKKTGEPYSCTFSLYSLSGEEGVPFEAKIQGDNYKVYQKITAEVTLLWDSLPVFVLMDGWVYQWDESDGKAVASMHNTKFDLKKARHLIDLNPEYYDIYFIPEPEADSPCVPIKDAEIIIPNFVFQDKTQEIENHILESEKQETK